MKRWTFQLYAMGMMCAGYSAGQRVGDRGDLLGWPWQANLAVGIALMASSAVVVFWPRR